MMEVATYWLKTKQFLLIKEKQINVSLKTGALIRKNLINVSVFLI